MKESRLLVTLLLPSALSLALSCLFALAILLGASWSYVSNLSFFSTYLSGSYGFSSLLHELNVTLGAAFNSNLSYNIAVICFALLVGLAIYVMVESIRHMLAEARATLTEVTYADRSSKGNIERTLGLRIGLRAVSAFVWIGYALFFFEAILPFCASSIMKGSASVTLMTSVRNLLIFCLLVLAAHIHVLFVRLIVLRPRLFGSEDVMISRGGH